MIKYGMLSAIWLSRIFLFLAALFSVLGIDLGPSFEQTFSYVSLPLLIILGISWIAPLVGGILALVLVPVWFYWLGISAQYWALALSGCIGLTLGGIFSILGYRRRLAATSTNKLRKLRYMWVLWISRLLIITAAYAAIGYNIDFIHVTPSQVVFALIMVTSVFVIWIWPIYGSIFIFVWVPLFYWYYLLNLQMPHYNPGDVISPGGIGETTPLVKIEMVIPIGGAILSLIWVWLNRKGGYPHKIGIGNLSDGV